ncbi:MAG: hypothetical protein ACYSTT_10355 [Planctomycetota bacterium]
MNRMRKSTWYYIVSILLLLAFGIYIAFEIAVLRRVPAALGRFAPSLTFWSNIILGFALRSDESIPIWIVPVFNLSLLLAVIVVYEIAIPVLRGCAREGERK